MFPPSSKQKRYVNAIEHSPAFAERVKTRPAPMFKQKPTQESSHAQRLAVALKIAAARKGM